MALTITSVPDQRAYLGESMEAQIFMLAPGTADYALGGYIITAAQVKLAKITGAWIIGINAAGITAADLWMFTLAQLNPPIAGLPQIALQAFNLVPLVEESAAHDFSGTIITAAFLGY